MDGLDIEGFLDFCIGGNVKVEEDEARNEREQEPVCSQRSVFNINIVWKIGCLRDNYNLYMQNIYHSPVSLAIVCSCGGLRSKY